jgi:DNA polymerase III subunit delta'
MPPPRPAAPTPVESSLSWSTLVGHAAQVEMLRRAATRGRLGSTLLFAGPHGIGKRRVAISVAQSLFCERHTEAELLACGECSACKQVAANTHPDLIVVRRPAGKAMLPLALFIGEDEARGKDGMCHELSLRPMSAGRRIAIIDEAELLGEEAANALLKTLEEPPPKSLIILLADAPESLLSTIRSRCQVIRFSPLADDEVAAVLRAAETDADEASIQAAADLAEGNLLTAHMLLDPALRTLRETVRSGLESARYDSVGLARLVWEQIEEQARETAAQRVVAHWVVKFAAEWHRQALSMIVGLETTSSLKLPEGFRVGDPDALDRMGELLERCLATESHIDANATVWLALESLFDDLGRMRREAVPQRRA